MKAQITKTPKILAVGALSLAVLGLTACGGEAHTKAVDKLTEAEAIAKSKAPTAEEVRFDDYGQPVMGGVGGAAGVNVGASAPTEATESTTNTATNATTTDAAEATN